jgi:hypothetical protein
MEPWIYFDFDADRLGRAYEEAREVIGELTEAGFRVERMYASFSGKKGFHVRLSSADLGLPVFENARHAHSTFKRFFRPLTERYGCLDPKPWSPLVPMRLTGSCHADTGRRKWTLPARTFADSQDRVGRMVGECNPTIRQVRRSDHLVSEFPNPLETGSAPSDRDLAHQFASVWESVKEELSGGGPDYNREERSDGHLVMPAPIRRAWSGVEEREPFAVGHKGRDEAAFMLACHFLRDGYSLEEVHHMLKLWDRKRNPSPLQDDPDEPTGVLRIKVNSAASRLYEDGTLQNLRRI